MPRSGILFENACNCDRSGHYFIMPCKTFELGSMSSGMKDENPSFWQTNLLGERELPNYWVRYHLLDPTHQYGYYCSWRYIAN